jgi:hypothetical protein
MKFIRWHGLACWLRPGMSRISINTRIDVQEVMLSGLLVAQDVTKWYQSHGFNTEPGWAMLLEVEEKISENICCRNGKNSSSYPMVSTLNLDGPQAREFRVKIPKNFDVPSVRRAWREHLDCVWKHRRCNYLRNDHRERNHNICVDWAVGSIREEDPSEPLDMEKSA